MHIIFQEFRAVQKREIEVDTFHMCGSTVRKPWHTGTASSNPLRPFPDNFHIPDKPILLKSFLRFLLAIVDIFCHFPMFSISLHVEKSALVAVVSLSIAISLPSVSLNAVSILVPMGVESQRQTQEPLRLPLALQ